MMMRSGGKAAAGGGDEEEFEEDLGIAEEASPISSRPPAAALAIAAPSSSSSRWPRQETLALLHIRSQMDSAFRDASILKAPLWEHLSRKLEEMGYKRSAKKCKEKFENVQKYYKRTKERQDQGRQDGKNYKFFSELDALHHNTMAPVASSDIPLRSHDHPPPLLPPAPHDPSIVSNEPRVALYTATATATATATSSSSEGDEDEMESSQNRNRKRKRGDYSVDTTSDDRMMEFIEGLMGQVMQKQEAMQQRFLDAIDKREQDRMAREEAWKRQDTARLIREHQLMSQERATVGSRDAAIVAFLQKVTGQTINLPTATAAVDPSPDPVPVSPLPHPILPHVTFQAQLQSLNQSRQPPLNLQESPSSQNPSLQNQSYKPPQESPSSQNVKTVDTAKAIPEQQKTLQEASSSRWPKVQVLALIQLRSNLDSRYQETGPKGPLWEDISSGMQRLGYNRSSKRCKEKWENINKYFKKVKENNKKRLEDSKTCPYFHELDALYSKKMLGSTGSNAAGSSSMDILGSFPEQQQSLQIKEQQSKDGGDNNESKTSFAGLFDERRTQGTIGGEKQQPVDIMRTQDQRQRHEKLMDYNFCDGSSSDQENNDEDEDEYGDDETEEQMKLAYNTQFKSQQNIGGSDNISIYHTIVQ